MMLINISDNSKVSKAIAIISMIAVGIGLLVQLLSLLAMTKSKLGKHIRRNVINAMYDTFDESIDEACTRMPKWMSKLNSLKQ